MMKPQSNGLVELHDAKRKELGFNCMQLIRFLTEDGVKEWEDWHGAHLEAAAGQCHYISQCTIYARTVEKQKNNGVQLSIF